MYRCRKCGLGGNQPLRIYDYDGSMIDICEHCKSDDIVFASAPCDICGKMLYEGENAYQAGDLLICPNCLTEVLV